MSRDLFYYNLSQALEQRKIAQHFRSLRPFASCHKINIYSGTRELINFSSNNYLGLANHPLVKQRAQDYLEQYGAGATASRLICGNGTYHETLEKKIASFTKKEAALLFSSGYQANTTLLPSLLCRSSAVIMDRLCHHSLITGAKASGARLYRYRHNDMEHLEEKLKTAAISHQQVMIITESVFSMDGDLANLQAVVKLAKIYDALVYVDEAHAFGILGRNGSGLAAGVEGVDFIMGGFGKAAGCFGAYFCCRHLVRDYLINTCPGVIYSTAPPPSVVGAIDAALDLIPSLDEKRIQLQSNISLLCKELKMPRPPPSPIIPYLIGDPKDALDCSSFLEEQGFLLQAIRPPTVPEGTSRLRITMTSEHTSSQIIELAKALVLWKKRGNQ